jgi:hypothetical protein
VAAAGRERQLMDTWRGHFPITNFVLQALLKKKAGETAQFSRTEGVLFNACEFWAAVATRELAQYLASRSVPRLLVAFEAFSEIGAVRVASALRLVISDCPEIPSPKWIRQHALDLEARLLDTEDSVDHLIGQFASEHLANDLSERQEKIANPRPGLAAPGN